MQWAVVICHRVLVLHADLHEHRLYFIIPHIRGMSTREERFNVAIGEFNPQGFTNRLNRMVVFVE